MPYNELTRNDWTLAVQEAVKRAKKFTRSNARAMELVQAAIAAALDPARPPWDPSSGRTLGHHLGDLAWSLYGNEITSAHATKVRDVYDDEEAETGVPSSRRPEALLVSKREATKAERLYAELRRRVADDPLIVLLIDHDADADLRVRAHTAADDDGGGDDADGDETASAPAPRPNAEPPSTTRALAKGYSLKDIRNARERLKRIATAVAKEDDEAHS